MLDSSVVRRIVVCLFFSSSIAAGQINTGSLDGVVQDTSGSAVPAATVTVTNQASGVKRDTETNDQGYFSVPLLQPGTYSVNAGKTGFATYLRKDIDVAVNQAVKVDISLQLGKVGEVVEVKGDAQALETESANLGTVIAQRQVADLPLNGRNYTQLLMLAPGVAPFNTNRPAPSLGGGGLVPSVNGQRARSNLFYVDGMYASDPMFQSFTISPSVDDIQEFKLQTHVDAAEFGQAAGAVVNVVTKSGTDQFHGSAYEFFRNSALDAKPFFAATKGAYRQNQFGATLGGPIIRHRTFFFVNYEGFRSTKASTNTAIIITPEQAAGNFQGFPQLFDPYSSAPDPAKPGQFTRTPYAGNIIPTSQINKGIINFVNLFLPKPNYSFNGFNYINTQPATTTQDQYNARIDHQFNERNQLYGRFSYSDTPNVAPNQIPTTATVTDFPIFNTVASFIHTFNPRLIGEITAGYQNNAYYQQAAQPEGAEQLVASDGWTGFPAHAGGTPYIQFPQMSVNGFFSDSSTWGPQGPWSLYQVSGSMTKMAGKHQLRFGGSFYHVDGFVTAVFPSDTFTNVPTANPQSQSNTGSAMASFVLGLPSSAFRYLGDASVTVSLATGGAWMQDTYRVSRKLTLVYGLRWDYAGPVHDIKNRFSTFNPYTNQWVLAKGNKDAPSTLPAGVVMLDRDTIVPSMGNSIGPRLGIAYQIDSKTVVRTGGSIMYDTWGSYIQFVQNPRGNWPTGAGQSPNGLNIGVINATAQNPFGTLPPTIPATPFPSGGYASDERYRSAQVFEWNFDLQRQITNALSLSVAYVGSHGSHTPIRVSYNTALTPGPGAVANRVPIPQMQQFNFDQAIGRDSYESLQVRATHRFSSGLSFLLAYTWSKSIDLACSGFGENCDIQNEYNLNANRSVSAYHVPQVFNANALYELPFGKGKPYASRGIANQLLGGWQISGIFSRHSGLPFSIQAGFDNLNVGGGSSRVNLVGNPYPSNPTLQAWLAKSAFAFPAQYTFGSEGRNALRGPAYVNLDFSVLRTFRLREAISLQFRAEFFNGLNHPNFNNPTAALNSSQFGVISGASSPRDIQFGLKLVF